jgi:hypothetical protein
MLMGSNDTAIDKVELSVKLTHGIGPLLQLLQEVLPQSLFAPSIETTGYGFPCPIAIRQVSPRSTRAQNP